MMKMNKYHANWESVKAHKMPEWFDDVKLGIFIHWGLYSIPAWAEVSKGELGEILGDEWFKHNSYAEWYLNTIRFEDSPARAYHNATYGADFSYERFAEQFLCEKWKPDEWAKLFAEAGAGYVVLTTKHHDGYCLYPSAYTDYNTMKTGPKRDLVGDLTNAVRKAGLRMGLYYSGLFDWTIGKEAASLETAKSAWSYSYLQTRELADYSRDQITELIDMYKPSVLWNDLGWPVAGHKDLPGIFAHYYNSVDEGVTNDRWTVKCGDYDTAEYKTGTRSLEKKWEMCRGLGLSFGYNQNEDESTVMSSRKLVETFCEFVATNGNLLINIGPKPDGTIPAVQVERLRDLGAWLREHGEAIYGTRPWETCQIEQLDGGATVYYAKKGDAVYAIIAGLTPGGHTLRLPAADAEVNVVIHDDMPVHTKI
jgi:alpha-L-fucosidase